MLTATVERETTASRRLTPYGSNRAARSRDHKQTVRTEKKSLRGRAPRRTLERPKPTKREVTPLAARKPKTRVRKVDTTHKHAEQHQPYSPPDDKWHLSLPKAFVYFGYVVSLGLLIVFGLDLATGVPFNRARILFDITYVLCGLGLAYLSWNAHRDLA